MAVFFLKHGHYIPALRYTNTEKYLDVECASKDNKDMKMPVSLSASRPQNQSTSMLLYVQDGMVVVNPKPTLQTPKQTGVMLTPTPNFSYRRMRTFVSLSFLLMLLLALFVQQGLASGTLQRLGSGLSFFSYAQFTSTDIQAAAHPALIVNASQQLVRISQLDPAQYNSSSEFNTWAYSACSAASMTEVFDAWGRHFRITDVLSVEAQIGAITPDQGLLDPSGVQQTAAQFGFKTNWGNSWSLDAVINTANSGKPVIVSFPPDRYDGGHILVVTGGDSNYVYLADTSLWNRQSLTRDQFLNWWEGFAAVVTPA